MFDKENVSARCTKVEHRSMEKDEKEIGLVDLKFEISPFTKELAADLDDFVRGTLYTRNDGEVSSKLRAVRFDLPIRPQELAVRAAVDQGKSTFTILEAKVHGIIATRQKKSTAWVLKFTVTAAPATEHQLAQMVECYLKSKYLTFADAEADLFAEESKEQKQARRASAGGAGGSAVAH